MKILVMIVHANVQQDLADRLRELDSVQGFSFSHAEGHGIRSEHDPFLSARDKVVGYVPRVRAEILLNDADVSRVLAELRKPQSGIAGQGFYWVMPVEEGGRL